MNSVTKTLNINDFRIWAYHGWFEEERIIGGEYRIDVSLDLNLPESNIQLTDTVDYQDVINIIKKVMSKEFKLIEDSCQVIHQTIIDSFKNLNGLRVTITKINIPINQLFSTSFTVSS